MKLEYLVGIVVLLFTAQFLYGIIMNPGSEFAGADGKVESVVADLNPDYQPWDIGIPKFTPPGGETESLLFALQAAIGALVIGYFFGYYRGKNQLGK
ncbi:MAG: cobalt/nickel transport protein [Methanolobus sp.]|jgi:cobalt/nickel transport protein|nr:cobalt/nickel transport protein [Methanolobus sp.]MDN5309032.1 cobalt/nickel transport protein [Methanolobus sp.]